MIIINQNLLTNTNTNKNNDENKLKQIKCLCNAKYCKGFLPNSK